MAIRIRIFLQYRALLMLYGTVLAFASEQQQSPQESDPSYLKFVFNASDFPSEDYYDYMIFGGGTAGFPLTATASHMYRALVLERGGIAYGKPNLMTQEGFLTTLMITLHKLSHLKMTS
ncbi:hypothetical protein L6164_004610 [Bauhinia variegata]|uniref:Uncharacterized protein n=1 Tax=Bauhinia variegata TaxID=167791 RepID=A0ACB9Q539_BAUVA|nr:hypothetical protein L6164_004610 [Bauhinia variegata]